MHPIYNPTINYLLRTLLRPFVSLIPSKYQFLITGKIKVKLPEGKRITLVCNPTSYVAKVLFWRGYQGYEYNLIKILIEIVKQSSTFIDVGANIGYYSILASVYNPELKVISFEPSPGAFKYLQTNVKINSLTNILTEKLALSDSAGEVSFSISKSPKFSKVENHLYGTAGFDEQHASMSSRTVETVHVETDQLDLYSERQLKTKIDIIKIDTEGSEHLVLNGSKKILAEHKPIIFCEVLPDRHEHELEEIFNEHKYLMFQAESGYLFQVEKLVHHVGETNDFIMVPPQSLPLIQPFIHNK